MNERSLSIEDRRRHRQGERTGTPHTGLVNWNAPVAANPTMTGHPIGHSHGVSASRGRARARYGAFPWRARRLVCPLSFLRCRLPSCLLLINWSSIRSFLFIAASPSRFLPFAPFTGKQDRARVHRVMPCIARLVGLNSHRASGDGHCPQHDILAGMRTETESSNLQRMPLSFYLTAPPLIGRLHLSLARNTYSHANVINPTERLHRKVSTHV